MAMPDLFDSPAPTSCGYRLDKLEVYNWGTFDSTHNTVHTVRPRGATTLLIGQNGSGKSTLVDALLTLLVRPNVRNYNVAAGAKKRERDERSYVKGAYGRLSRAEDNGTQVEFLRPGNRHYSALLACFRNDRDEAFTLAQVLYLNADNAVEKVYCYADREKSIAEDCANLTATDKVRRQLEQRGFKTTDKYADYLRWFERKTGVLPKAMDMFNQTVAVKDIQSLNDFIRNHMLEDKSWGERINNLQSHFTELTQAYQSLVRVRRQYELLRPIAEHGAEYRARASALAEAQAVLAAVKAYFLIKRVELIGPAMAKRQTELEKAGRRKTELEESAERVREELRQLKNELERSGGNRLREIPHLIREQELAARTKHGNRVRFREALATADLQGEPVTADELAELQRSLPRRAQSLDAAIAKRKADRDTTVLERGDVHRRLDDDRREFQALGERPTKIPEELAEVRRRLCADLGVAEEELPFAAELIAVDPKERAWEASAELVLNSFAKSLLVPQKHYALVSAHLNRTRVQDARGRGQRLVYLRIGSRAARSRPLANPRSLIQKLRLKDGHPLIPWLKDELDERYNYQCCDTIEELQNASGPAMTRERHIRYANGTRHEKDDRDRATDPRYFILGWDNREKRRHLAGEIERLGRELADLDSRIGQLDAELGVLEKRKAGTLALMSFADFAEFDAHPHELEIERLRAEQRALEEGNQTVQAIKAQMAELESQQRQLQQDRDEIVAEEAQLKSYLREAAQVVEHSRQAVEQMAKSGELETHTRQFGQIDQCFLDSPLTAEDVVGREPAFREQRQALVNRLQEEIEPLRSTLQSEMSRFLREFKEEQSDLDARIDYLDPFCDKFEQIQRDDLPRYEQRFKERLNENVAREIGFLHGAFRTECAEINEKVALLNESLRQLEYRRGTRMRLEPRPVRDVEVAEFQTALRECLAETFERSDAADEARYVRISNLLTRLRDDERWRHRVTDVRRWFDFVAIEFDAETNAERHFYTDSSGQSGGEKAKLAFTILVAAIAYQYDIDPARPTSDRFRFVAVDEMFSKVDDRYAEYALELFKKFGLQLLIVAPLDAKARVTEPYVGCYLHVSIDQQTHRSEVLAMTAQEFQAALLSPSAAAG